jgi:uncharacterized membrane protein YphA (DoxX/SURF4 family)
MKNKYHFLVTIISILLILLFSYAAVSKLMDYHNFIGQLRSSDLLKPIAGILTWLIPTVEFYVVLLLLVPGWKKSGMILSSVLMFLFTAYITVMLMFFKKIPCSCGGVLQNLSWHQHLVFNIVFLLLAIVGTVLIQKTETQSPATD